LTGERPADEAKELLLLNGATSGTGPTGTFNLTGDIIVTGQTKFVIPKGMTLKGWARTLASLGAFIINWQYANDGSTFRTLYTDVLTASQAEFESEYASRPRVFRSSAGTEAVQITYSGAAVGGTVGNVAFNLELTQD